MHSEATISLEDYLAQAPNRKEASLRYQWHLERYRFAKGRVRPGSVVADIGCGLGFGSEELALEGHSVNAFDINPQVVKYVSEKASSAKVSFSIHDVTSGPIPNGPYDLVCMFEVIEHLEDPGACLEHIKRSLKPGGQLILSTPNSQENSATHPHHAFEFDPHTFGELLAAHFTNVEMFSQGTRRIGRQYEDRKEADPVINALRRLDFLKVRRLLPNGLRSGVTDKRVGISIQQVRWEKVAISPGWSNDAHWLIAVCALPEAQ